MNSNLLLEINNEKRFKDQVILQSKYFEKKKVFLVCFGNKLYFKFSMCCI